MTQWSAVGRLVKGACHVRFLSSPRLPSVQLCNHDALLSAVRTYAPPRLSVLAPLTRGGSGVVAGYRVNEHDLSTAN